MPSTTRILATTIALLTAAGMLAACGSDGGGDDDRKLLSPAQTVEDYLTAVVEGDFKRMCSLTAGSFERELRGESAAAADPDPDADADADESEQEQPPCAATVEAHWEVAGSELRERAYLARVHSDDDVTKQGVAQVPVTFAGAEAPVLLVLEQDGDDEPWQIVAVESDVSGVYPDAPVGADQPDGELLPDPDAEAVAEAEPFPLDAIDVDPESDIDANTDPDADPEMADAPDYDEFMAGPDYEDPAEAEEQAGPDAEPLPEA